MATEDQQRQEARTSNPNSNAKTERGLERTVPTSAPVRRAANASGPFSLMRRFSEDVDRLFGGILGSDPFRLGAFAELLGRDGADETTFWPEIEVQHVGDKLAVQVDVPGLKKEEVSVEIRGNDLCISGERRSESERNEDHYYRTERSYGSFCRTVRLPDGAKPDTASATFENGVIKIEMEAPAAQAHGRKIEVREGSPH
jgi:HSP20 family protein